MNVGSADDRETVYSEMDEALKSVAVMVADCGSGPIRALGMLTISPSARSTEARRQSLPTVLNKYI